MKKHFAKSKVRESLSKLDEGFKSYKHLKLLTTTKNFKTLNDESRIELSKNIGEVAILGSYVEFQKKIISQKQSIIFKQKLEGRYYELSRPATNQLT